MCCALSHMPRRLQADKYERKCRVYAAEVEEARGELERREREGTALAGQLAAAQAGHAQALGRLETLAGQVAAAQQDKVGMGGAGWGLRLHGWESA